MENTGRCVAVSEPNSPTFVVTKYRKFGDSSELRQLTRDIIRWECRPYMAMQPPPLCYFLKLIAPCVVVLPLLRQRHLLTVLVLLSVLFCYVIPMKLGLGLKATIFGLALTGVRAS